VNTGGALGPNRFDLFKPSGHETVGHAGDFTLSIDYKVSGSTLNATLTSEPWAIVSIDGVRSGKTPVELPALTRRPISLELTHPGVTSARALLAGEVEP
jgi:hypothetical protein